ncbi:MAG: hypothetical protein K2N78_00945 [Oscillospiraceae bacterium]|nr:hypothetical protein [Oscillospiraceae bacterium]
MEWKVRPAAALPGISQVQLKDSKLQWDFLQGSPYDLCAIFPWDGKMALLDYQRDGVRPILYHKKLKTMRSVLYDDGETPGYRLYPAVIENDMLYITDQPEGSGVLRNPVQCNISVHILRKKKGILGTKYLPDSCGSISLSFDSAQEKLFYQVTSSKRVYPPVCASVTKGEIWICLHPNETAEFYKDEACKEKVLQKR